MNATTTLITFSPEFVDTVAEAVSDAWSNLTSREHIYGHKNFEFTIQVDGYDVRILEQPDADWDDERRYVDETVYILTISGESMGLDSPVTAIFDPREYTITV